MTVILRPLSVGIIAFASVCTNHAVAFFFVTTKPLSEQCLPTTGNPLRAQYLNMCPCTMPSPLVLNSGQLATLAITSTHVDGHCCSRFFFVYFNNKQRAIRAMSSNSGQPATHAIPQHVFMYHAVAILFCTAGTPLHSQSPRAICVVCLWQEIKTLARIETLVHFLE